MTRPWLRPALPTNGRQDSAYGLGLLLTSALWLRYEIAMARGAAPEGAAFMLLLGTYAFGLPSSLPVGIIADHAEPLVRRLGANGIHVMLLNVIVNWALLFWAFDRYRDRRRLLRGA